MQGQPIVFHSLLDVSPRSLPNYEGVLDSWKSRPTPNLHMQVSQPSHENERSTNHVVLASLSRQVLFRYRKGKQRTAVGYRAGYPNTIVD